MNQKIDFFREVVFRQLIEKVLRHPGLMVLATVGIFAVVISLIPTKHLRFTFFPSPPGGIMVVDMSFVSGTPEKAIQKFLKSVEHALVQAERELSKQKQSHLVNVVTKYRISGNETLNYQYGDERASIYVELSTPDARDFTNEAFREKVKSQIALPPEIETFTIAQPKNGPRGIDIDLMLYGGETAILKKAAEEVKNQLLRFKGVYNIRDTLPYGKPQLLFHINDRGRALGLTPAAVGSQLQAAFSGKLAQIYYSQYDEIEVRTLLPKWERDQINTLNMLPIKTPNGKMVPLKSVITLNPYQGFDVLTHTDTIQTVNVFADVDNNKGNANLVLASLQAHILPDILKKYHLQGKIRGKAEEQAETFSDMKYGLVIGLSLMYFVLAWIFASYQWPLLVLVTIPFGLTGALLGHWWMGMDLTLISLFGFFWTIWHHY